jgi:hypothetical protein
MQRIQYHGYDGPEEMRLETYELPAIDITHRHGCIRILEFAMSGVMVSVP